VGVYKFLKFNVVSEPQIMMSDGSVRVSVDCDVTASTSASVSFRKSAVGSAWKGKNKAPPRPAVADVRLKPKIYMGFLMRFIHKQLFIRNTKDMVVDDYNVPQVDSTQLIFVM